VAATLDLNKYRKNLTMMLIKALRCASLLLTCGLASAALAQQAAVRGGEAPNQRCGPIFTNHYGPFDYRSQREPLKVVEEFHYTARVEAGMGGATGPIGGDLNYTLMASPNHHRALMTLTRVLERGRTDRIQGMQWGIDCYFDRAIRFKPDDTVVRVLFAQYLHKNKRTSEATAQLDAAVPLAADNPFSHYNIGLMYLEIGQPDKALVQAHKAAALGFARQELAEQLKRINKWQEPPAAAASSASEPAK
jgi:tetratricopeptide (TPR) repeat protein